MVDTHEDELALTGSWSTRAFQILSAGKTGQLPSTGPWATARLASPASTTTQRKVFRIYTPKASIVSQCVTYNRVSA